MSDKSALLLAIWSRKVPTYPKCLIDDFFLSDTRDPPTMSCQKILGNVPAWWETHAGYLTFSYRVHIIVLSRLDRVEIMREVRFYPFLGQANSSSKTSCPSNNSILGGGSILVPSKDLLPSKLDLIISRNKLYNFKSNYGKKIIICVFSLGIRRS